jgi:predicted ATPase
LARCEARDERWYEAELLRIKGELLLHAGRQRSVADAERHFERAIEVARQQGAVFWELRTAVSLARLRMSQDRDADAHRLLTSACGKFTEGFATSDMRDAKAMIAQLSPR